VEQARQFLHNAGLENYRIISITFGYHAIIIQQNIHAEEKITNCILIIIPAQANWLLSM